MSGILMMVIAIVVLGGAYLLYGRYLQNKWGIDPNAKTPAYEMEDGVDYVPADTNVVFGHQFASIAGAGPINGPIQAAIFGWLPVLLWILIGGVFFGAVQDFASMYASVKNKGRTIGYIIEEYIGKLGNPQYLFPILFVTIACGAVSGFHSLVSSGTASKQIKNEKNMLPVSFGAMLMESMLAILALIAVASFGKGEAAAQGLTTQPQIFAGAIANFLSVLGLPHSLVFTLINLAVSAFALTSLDSVARVGRLSFQEFWLDSDTDDDNMSPFVKLMTNKYFATIITLVLAFLLTKVGYAEIWPLFGSANQLLSVLALVACAVFLKKTKRQGCMLWIPMVFMMAVTFTALGMTIYKLTKALFSVGLDLGNSLQLIFAVLLLILGVLVAIQGVKKLCEKSESKKAAA